MLQLAAFALFLSAWALQPSFDTMEELAKAQRLGILARWPTFWFFGLFSETSDIFPIASGALARLACLALAAVVAGAGLSLLLCYVRTMKKTVEQPDLEPTRGRQRWLLPLGDPLQTAIVRFSMGLWPEAASTGWSMLSSWRSHLLLPFRH